MQALPKPQPPRVKEHRRWGPSGERGLNLSKWHSGLSSMLHARAPPRRWPWEALVYLARSACADLRREIRVCAKAPAPTGNIPNAKCVPSGPVLLDSSVLAHTVQGNGSLKLGCQAIQMGTEAYVQQEGRGARRVSARQQPVSTLAACLSQECTLVKMANGQ